METILNDGNADINASNGFPKGNKTIVETLSVNEHIDSSTISPTENRLNTISPLAVVNEKYLKRNDITAQKAVLLTSSTYVKDLETPNAKQAARGNKKAS